MALTPTQIRLPLPTSHSNIFAQRPITSEQWQVAIKGIKVLYLKRHYKKCAARCTQLLTEAGYNIHPVHRTFLHFYSAVCFEILARATHNLSINKLPLLLQAKEAYQNAEESLPFPPSESEDGGVEEQGRIVHLEDLESEYESLATPSTIASTTARSSIVPSPTPTDPSTPASSISGDHDIDKDRFSLEKKEDEFTSAMMAEIFSSHTGHSQSILDNTILDPLPLESPLRPAPLRIRKDKDKDRTVHFDQSPEKPIRPKPMVGPRRPLPKPPTHLAPLRVRNINTIDPNISLKPLVSKSQSMSSYLFTRSLERYNATLTSLRPHIMHHISAVDSLIAHATFLQEERRKSAFTTTDTSFPPTAAGWNMNATTGLRNSKRLASFWSFKPVDIEQAMNAGCDGRGRTQEQRDRIERLKANGWRIGSRDPEDVTGLRFKGSRYYEKLCEKALRELGD